MCDFQGKSNIRATLPHVPFIHPLQYIVNTLLSLKVIFPHKNVRFPPYHYTIRLLRLNHKIITWARLQLDAT